MDGSGESAGESTSMAGGAWGLREAVVREEEEEEEGVGVTVEERGGGWFRSDQIVGSSERYV
jgi:hypothetical protein